MLSSYLICRDNIFIFGVFWVFPSSGPFLYEEHFVTLIVGCWVIDVLLFWKCFWKWVCWFIFFNIFMVWPVYYPDVLQFWTSCIWDSLEMLLQWSYDKFSLFWEIMARIADWLRENMWRLSIESERLSLPYSVAIFVASNYFFTARPDAFQCLCYFYWGTILTLFLNDHTRSSWARILVSWRVSNYHGFVGTSAHDVVWHIVGISKGADNWSFVSERISKRFGMWNISKLAGVSFGIITWLTLYFLVCDKNCKICLVRDLKFSKGLPMFCVLFLPIILD